MMKNKWFLVMVIAALVFAVAGCGEVTDDGTTVADDEAVADDETIEEIELRWGTIQAGGAWEVLGSTMLESILSEYGDQISGSTLPGSSAVNIMGLHADEYNIAFGAHDNTLEAWYGEGRFEESGEIQDIRNIHTNLYFTTHIVVRADSGIVNIPQDLVGKRISPGPQGVSGDTQTQRWLALHGLSYDDVNVEFLSFTDAAQEFIDGHIDALTFLTVPPPFSAVVEVNAQRDIVLMDMPDEDIARLAEMPGVVAYTMPGGIYDGIDYPVKGIAVRSHIAVREDMPEEFVYMITKTLVENHELYQQLVASFRIVEKEDIVFDIGIPWHDGALRYYQEVGLLD
jgi:uncharacterized protein